MQATENKRILWDLTKHLYKSWMPRERVIQAFEETIREVDASSAPLLDKNKTFLQVYMERVAAMQPETAQERELMFEGRQKHHELNVIHVPTPPKKVAFEDTQVLQELAELKQRVAADHARALEELVEIKTKAAADHARMLEELVDIRKMVHIMMDRTQSRL